jgi:flagellar hook-associated protein 3 FlgL
VSTRITQAMIARSTLSDLQSVADRLSATQRKLSSGKEITRPSDNPYGTSRALVLRGQLEGNQQYQRNVGEAGGWLTVTDTALGTMGDVVQRARELLVQGGNDTGGQSARDAIALEIDNLVDSLKQEADAQYEGRYVFSGTATQTRPYALGASDSYAGDAGQVAREIGPGVSVTVGTLGSALLGSGQGAADGKLIDTLRTIAQHLRGGTPADGDALRTTDLQALDANLDSLQQARASVGALQRRLDSAQSRPQQIEETTTSLLSQVEDADMAKTYTDFSTQQAVYQSALKAGSNIVQASLLDFLK